MAPCLSSPRGRSEPSRVSSTLTPRQPRAEPGGAEAGCGEVSVQWPWLQTWRAVSADREPEPWSRVQGTLDPAGS